MTRAAVQPGTVIAGRYEVEGLIGQGGMGAIYRVRHLKMRRHFALKTLAAELNAHPEALARFHREADLIAGFRHPNIVEIIDRDTLDDGSPCMVMELLEGEDLGRRLERGPLDWATIAARADEVLSALAVAHRAGIVHRDLKPQNVFLARDDTGEERSKLLDFGVSKIRSSRSHMTADAQLLGTPAYMAPEQVNGPTSAIGPATDVWAMGAILLEMATGAPAFTGETPMAVLYRICHGQPASLEAARPDAPMLFRVLVTRALSRGADRIGDADELRRGLREALGPRKTAFADQPTRVAERATARPSAPSPAHVTTLSRATGQLAPSQLAPSQLDRPATHARGRLVAGAVVALALAMGSLALVRKGTTSPSTTAHPAAAATAPAPQPGPTPRLATPEPVVVKEPVRRVPVLRVPAEARVWLDGVEVTGDEVAITAGGPHEVRASARGYLDASWAFDPAHQSALRVQLKRPPARPTRPRKPREEMEFLDP